MVIFLDIDGVLNQLQGNYYLDDNCVSNLGLICKKLNAKVVLTSSWRKGYTNLGKCTPQIEKLKLSFSKYNIVISGRTASLGDRKEEIKSYIKSYNITDYIVIDDDMSEFKSGLLGNTYFVNPKTGLTKQDVKKIIKRC